MKIKTLSLLLLASSLLHGQVQLSATLDPIPPTPSALIGGINPPLVTVSLASTPLNRVPIYNAQVPRNVPVLFHVSSIPAGVKGVHYSIQSVGGGITSTVPNHKQQFVPPSLSSDPFTLTVLGPDAAIVWYPHETDPNPIEAANQLSAQQQRLPFVVIDAVVPTVPNGVTRANNTFTSICNGWRMATSLDLTVTPVTFGIKDLLCIYSSVTTPTPGTNVSCSLATVACFNPVTVFVP